MSSFNYDYLANLTLEKQSGLYDLFITTYSGRTVQLRAFFLDKKHEMRMDLVSKDIYNTPDYVGTLCQLNSILNPFSVNRGDIIFYCTRDDAQSLMKVASELKFSRIEELLNAGKSTLTDLSKKAKADPNRLNFLDKRNELSLPPTMLPKREQNITANNQFIVIGGSSQTGGQASGNPFLGQSNDFSSLDSNENRNSMVTLNDVLANGYKTGNLSDVLSATNNPSITTANSVILKDAGNPNNTSNIDSLALLQEVLAAADNSSPYGSYNDTKSINSTSDQYDRILVKRYIRRID